MIDPTMAVSHDEMSRNSSIGSAPKVLLPEAAEA
jgi:hypothetical protein